MSEPASVDPSEFRSDGVGAEERAGDADVAEEERLGTEAHLLDAVHRARRDVVGEGAQGGRHERDDVDLLPTDPVGKPTGPSGAQVVRAQRRAVDEHFEDAALGRGETEGGGERMALAESYSVAHPHPNRARDDVAVPADHTLRDAGGARREQHQPRVVVRDVDARCSGAVAADVVDHDDPVVSDKTARDVDVLARGDHELGAARVDQTLEALRRFAGVDRRTDEAGVEHAADGDDGRDAVTTEERYGRGGIGLAVEECVRDLVGARDDLCVGDALVAGVDRDLVGDLTGDLGHRLRDREVHVRQQVIAIPPERRGEVPHSEVHRFPCRHPRLPPSREPSGYG